MFMTCMDQTWTVGETEQRRIAAFRHVVIWKAVENTMARKGIR